MFNLARFTTIFFCVLIILHIFSVAVFYYPPLAHVFALNLRGAKLQQSDLSQTNLASGDLRKGNLSGAILKGTDLRGADLTDAVGLTREQLSEALVDEQTILPDYLKPSTSQDDSVLKFEPSEVTIPLNFVPNKVALASDSSFVAVVGETEEVKLCHISENLDVEQLPPLKGLEGNGRSVCFGLMNGRVVAVGSDDGTIRLWTIDDGKLFKVLKGTVYKGYVFNMKFATDGRSLVSASQDEKSHEKTVYVWDVQQETAVSTVQVSQAERIVDLSPERRLMLVSHTSLPLDAQLRSMENGSLVRKLEGGKGEVTVGAFSSDGRLVAIGARQSGEGESPNGSVFIWQVDDGLLLTGPSNVLTDYAVSLDFSRDGQLLAIGWSDGSISLWDVGQAKRLITFGAHTGEVSNIALNADGRVFASIGTDRSMKLWQVVER
jgi:WD40 repeat protein